MVLREKVKERDVFCNGASYSQLKVSKKVTGSAMFPQVTHRSIRISLGSELPRPGGHPLTPNCSDFDSPGQAGRYLCVPSPSAGPGPIYLLSEYENTHTFPIIANTLASWESQLKEK